MHLYFYARGISHQVELWKIFMQSQFWKWKRYNLKKKKDEFILVQGSLRPSFYGTWEYVFPKECLADVLSIMGIANPHTKKDGYAGKGYFTFANSIRNFGARKLLGAKAIPKKIWEAADKIEPSILIDSTWRGLSHCRVDGVAIHPIGIKEDVEYTWKETGYRQEML